MSATDMNEVDPLVPVVYDTNTVERVIDDKLSDGGSSINAASVETGSLIINGWELSIIE